MSSLQGEEQPSLSWTRKWGSGEACTRMYPKLTRSSSVSSETLAHLDVYYVEASGFQLTHRQPDLTSRSAAFLNCQCGSAVPLIPLSSQKCTGQQLNSMVLLKDLVLPFFFPEEFKGSRTWTSVMIWAALIKKAGSPTYLIWQRTSNMDLTLFFSLSRPSFDTEWSWTKPNRVKEWRNTCKRDLSFTLLQQLC